MSNKNLFFILLFLSINIIQGQEIEKDESLQTDKKTKNENLHKDKETKNDAEKNIYLNFENTELSNFINYIAELKKINLIPHKTLEGVKVSLTIREPLTIEGAWNVFLTVLEMSGFSIIKIGEVNVVIQKKDKVKQPLPSYINVPIETLPDSDINIRYVTFLENINVNKISDLVKSMLSPEHNLIVYSEVNGLIITDKSYNIKSAMKVIKTLDQTGLQEAVVVMKLKNVNAPDVKALFDSLIQKEDNSSPLARLLGKQAEATLQYFSSTTRIIAEERTNSLILLGNKDSIKKIEDFIVEHIDTQLKGTVSPLHVYELQYIDALQLKTILEKVTDVSNLGEQASKYGAVRNGVKYFKAMKFQVDEDGNRLIVSSSDKQDWKLLKKTIKDLDKPQPQVAIESMFVTIDTADGKYLGGSIRNKKSGQIGKHINFQSPNSNGVVVNSDEPNNLLGNMLNAITGGLGSTIISFGKNTNIWAVFEALQSQTNANILSQPFLTLTNKTKGNLIYGNTVRVVKSKTQAGYKSYENEAANTTLNITPQINTDGIIRLTLNVKIEEFTTPDGTNKDKKVVKTDIAVADGQVIALGGFIKNKVTEGYKKTPILGEIPGLGWFFKRKAKTITKNYIFIFISPTIIKPRETPGTNFYTRIKLHQAREYIDESIETGKTKDPINNWFFNTKSKKYSQKVVDFANARYQPTTVDIKNDPYYRIHTETKEIIDEFDQNENTKAKQNKPVLKISNKHDYKKSIINKIDFEKLNIKNPYKKKQCLLKNKKKSSRLS